MIVVQYPPTLTRNFQGDCSIVPCYFTELYIDESGEGDKDILESIRDASFQILRTHKYPSIFHFMVNDLGGDLASIHFQIPKYSIEQDSMEPDERSISYYGVVRYGRVEGNMEDYII